MGERERSEAAALVDVHVAALRDLHGLLTDATAGAWAHRRAADVEYALSVAASLRERLAGTP